MGGLEILLVLVLVLVLLLVLDHRALSEEIGVESGKVCWRGFGRLGCRWSGGIEDEFE
jgi:hypothetical protein